MHRQTSYRIAGCVAITLIACASVNFLYPGGLARMWEDTRDYRWNVQRLEAAETSELDLDVNIQNWNDRHRFMKELCSGMVEASVSLRDAADAYLVSVAAAPGLLDRFRDAIPGGSDSERMAVALLRYIFVTYVDDSRKEELLAEFRLEYRSEYPLPVTVNTFTDMPNSKP